MDDLKSDGGAAGLADVSRRDGASLDADYERCAQVTRRSRSSFYYAFILLPPERRRALHAVYAFCRFIDDIADDEAIREPALLLKRWREELDRVYAGAPTRALSRALADSARRFKIPRELFEEIINGVEMDLSRKRYQTFEELRLYCYRVASAVGLICIEIFGYSQSVGEAVCGKSGTRASTDQYSARRARGCRARANLSAAGGSRALQRERGRNPWRRVLAELRQTDGLRGRRARELYALAQSELAPEDRATLLTAEAMRLIYGALLERIINSNYRVLDRRHSLSAPRKLYLVGRAWAGGRLSALRG